MALPANFNHWEHLQDMIRREHNKIVARYFSDLGDATWEPNLSSSRAQLRTACTIQDKDTAVQTHIRLYLFYEVLGYGRKRLGNFYGIPAREFQESFAGRPQCFIFLSQEIFFFIFDGSVFYFSITNLLQKNFDRSKSKVICSYGNTMYYNCRSSTL